MLKKWFKAKAGLCLTAALIVSSVQLGAASAAEQAAASNGRQFSTLHATNEAFSSMDSYLVKPANVSAKQDGTYEVTVTVKESSLIQEFKVSADQDSASFDGEFADVAVVSENKEADQRVVRFDVKKLDKLVKAKVRVVTSYQGTPYDMTHNVRFNFNGVDNIALQEAINVVNGILRSAAAASYSDEAKGKLGAAVAEAGKVAVNGENTQQQSNDALAKLQAVIKETQPTAAGDGALADGEYSIAYTILKADADKTSVMQDYVIAPGKIEVVNGKVTAFITLKQSKEITELKFNGEPVKVESEDKTANTRVVSFPVAELDKIANGWVKIVWPAVNYNNEYDIRISFDVKSIKALEGGGEQPAAPNPAASFTDIGNSWAKAYINRAVELGIVAGFEDNTFKPNATITRGEISALISRALKLQGDAASVTFKDFASTPAWAKPYIAAVSQKGLILGYEDQSFRAANPITRVELTAIMARAAGLKADAGTELTFADAASIPSWAKGQVSAAVAAGLIEGDASNRFNPAKPATRAEASVLVVRLLETLGVTKSSDADSAAA